MFDVHLFSRCCLFTSAESELLLYVCLAGGVFIWRTAAAYQGPKRNPKVALWKWLQFEAIYSTGPLMKALLWLFITTLILQEQYFSSSKTFLEVRTMQ